jgi:hypothetical protein
MIYENEELRLRTININAEVERGQSEIKNLKRERELLRKEIWTLRDEYDKLERLLKIKGINPDEFINNKNQTNEEFEQMNNIEENDECNSSCSCSSSSSPDEEETVNGREQKPSGSCSGECSTNSNDPKKPKDNKLHVNFDHLSVVSEENLTNSECNSTNHGDNVGSPVNDISSFLHKADVVSPLCYLQSIVPPLTHFENIKYDEIGGNIGEF